MCSGRNFKTKLLLHSICSVLSRKFFQRDNLTHAVQFLYILTLRGISLYPNPGGQLLDLLTLRASFPAFQPCGEIFLYSNPAEQFHIFILEPFLYFCEKKNKIALNYPWPLRQIVSAPNQARWFGWVELSDSGRKASSYYNRRKNCQKKENREHIFVAKMVWTVGKNTFGGDENWSGGSDRVWGWGACAVVPESLEKIWGIQNLQDFLN